MEKIRQVGARAAIALAAILFFCGGSEIVCRHFFRHPSLLENLQSFPGAARGGYYFLNNDRLPRLKRRHGGNPLAVPTQRGPKTFRIATFGESAAAGIPFHPSLAFSHYLQRLLAYRWPQAEIQVYNLAFACQTYRFAGRATRDVLALSPDLLIYYCGNNETLGTNPGAIAQRMSLWPGLLIRFDEWLADRSAAYSLLDELADRWRPDGRKLPYFRPIDSPLALDAVIRSYGSVTDDIITSAKQSGAQVLYLTPLREVKDFPVALDDPAFSPMTPEEAQAAVRSPLLRPEPRCRLGRYYLAQGMLVRARDELVKAADDQGGLCHTRIEDLIRNLPTRYPGVRTIDLEKDFERLTGSPIFGSEILVDQVHLNFTTHLHIAAMTADLLTGPMTRRFGPAVAGPLDPSQATFGNVTAYEAQKASGFEGAGMLNLGYRRWVIAADFMRRALAHHASVRAALGLAQAEIKMGHPQKGTAILDALLRSTAGGEIDETVRVYFHDAHDLKRLLADLHNGKVISSAIPGY